ncbi:XK-related protein domain-containing protein [Phthorimaea operculella]|nr:XK-related protein domain-containing protein [Phthorimaea operculella]
MAEFLPLCDVLFNVISLAGYFCDVVFDVVMGYALLERGYKGTFAAAISIVITSLLISQVISLRWYLHVWWGSGAEGAEGAERRGRPPWLPLLLHCFALGVVWRYARLLVPVELRRVKHQVRDLCMLRLVHAFCEAAPMLLLQLHVLVRHREQQALAVPPDTTIDEPAANAAFAELNVISAALSLFSVCWALASFSKNVRRHNVHRLLLTWLGVIFQFLWRLGTISSRVCALTVYALVYEYWVFLVIGLHWLSMYLWLMSPKSVFHGERLSKARKAGLSALLALVYVFAYINLQDSSHRQKMLTFYSVMFVENCLLVVAVWWSGQGSAPASAAAIVIGAFLAGLGFMLVYYR